MFSRPPKKLVIPDIVPHHQPAYTISPPEKPGFLQTSIDKSHELIQVLIFNASMIYRFEKGLVWINSCIPIQTRTHLICLGWIIIYLKKKAGVVKGRR